MTELSEETGIPVPRLMKVVQQPAEANVEDILAVQRATDERIQNLSITVDI